MTTAGVVLRPGDLLGGYRIDDVIGMGGMAIVYRAVQLSLERPVALKVLSGPLTRDPTFRERFRREALYAASLEHPNIVPVYDSGEHEDLLYIAMRLIEGGTLADRLMGDGLSPAETLAVLRPVAGALDAAHEALLVHRDIKPQNIILARDRHPYLADFGIAKGNEMSSLTVAGGFVGSVNYASPEQIRSQPLTPASDIYSFTAMTFQCLTGQLPYPRETDAGIMHAHLEEPPPALPDGEMPAADGLQEAIARGMAKAPPERFETASALVDAVAAAIQTLAPEDRNRRAAFSGFVPAPPPPQVVAQDRGPAALSGLTTADRVRGADGDGLQAGVRRRRWWQRAESGGAAPTRSADYVGRRWLAGAILVAVCAPLVVLVVGLGGGGSAGGQAAESRLLGVAFAPPWGLQPATSAPIAGLDLKDPAALSTKGAGQAAVIRLGLLADPAPVPAGLPVALARRFAGDGPTATTVRAGELVARRYDGRLTNGGALTVLIAATDRGDVAVGCERPRALALTAALCSSVLASTALRGARARPPGPDAALARGLAGALAPLARVRVSGAVDVADLKLRAARLSALATATGRAGDAIGRLAASDRDRAAVSRAKAALADEAVVLRELAAAARLRHVKAYARSSARLAETQRALDGALTQLAARGYRITRAVS